MQLWLVLSRLKNQGLVPILLYSSLRYACLFSRLSVCTRAGPLVNERSQKSSSLPGIKSCLGVGCFVGLLVIRAVKTAREWGGWERRERNERRGRAMVSLYMCVYVRWGTGREESKREIRSLNGIFHAGNSESLNNSLGWIYFFSTQTPLWYCHNKGWVSEHNLGSSLTVRLWHHR